MNLTNHFTAQEMTCKCGCNQQKMDPIFLTALESLRVAYGKPKQQPRWRLDRSMVVENIMKLQVGDDFTERKAS
ncbi:MAG: hypothetical protein H7836_02295 [Magnetococcus sp. YQC-3]